MGKLTILGNANPVIGQKEMYSVSSINDDWLNPLSNTYKNPLQAPKTHWEVMVETKTGWRKGGSDKEGQTVPYTFGQKSLMHKGIKIIVQQGENKGELIVHPQRAKEPKITLVELLDANYKPIPKGKKLSYRDTVIARAFCVEMFKMQVAFTLWEDDAKGEGHDPITNALNKINPTPVLGTVDIRGIAEAVFRLPFYTMAVQIANARIASGDKNEGAAHEYYVTVDVVNKNIQKASANVNVTNPTYNPEPPKRQRTLPQNTPPKPKPPAEKPKPKPDSSKFPVTTGGKSQSDGQGKILSAEFVDKNGNKLHSSKVGTTVFLKITAKNMKNKKVKVKIWEEDNFKWTNDLIFEKDYVLVGDANFVWVQLTKKMFDKASDGSDSRQQDYFIEVIHNETSVTSEIMPVSADAEPTKVESGRTATSVGKTKQERTPASCICKEQYKDLIWGGKVSCEFRKKVIQICAELWGESRKMEMANGLMAVMKVETWGSFRAHHREGFKSANDNPKDLTISSFHKDSGSKSSRAVGLIQFTQDALEGMNEFPKSTPATKGTQPRYDALNRLKLSYAQMGEIRQLDKVKKYFEPAKSKIKTPEDIYLHVFAPKGVGQKDDFLLYAKDTIEYKNNNSVDKDNNGIQRKEILARFYESKNEGIKNKTSNFTCGISDKKDDDVKATGIVTYHIYADGKIEKHIPKKIKSGYEQKYKYVFHDKENKEHEICIVDFIFANKRNNGMTISSIPKGYTKTYSYPRGGNAQTAYVYPNGDICVEGTRYGFKKYPKGSGKVELVRMKDGLSYNNGNVKIYYSFKSSQRRYCNPESYAGLIGALATLGRTDVLCTGMCFEDATSYPSVTHPNGDSADTAYYSTLAVEQKKVNAFKHFNFKNIYRGKTGWYPNLIGTKYSKGHEDHLHAGDFDSNIVKTIKE